MAKYIAKKPNKEGVIAFNAQDNHTWHQLITRQQSIIERYACEEFCDGLAALELPSEYIPQLKDVNQKIRVTGWEMVQVDGTVGVTQFFAMLEQRKFPVATFVRTPDEMDYLQQPDIFHEIFGHGPLLMLPAYADFIQWYGHLGSKIPHKLRPILSRLFWYTIEFGLINTKDGLRIYGGGILSSCQETLFALDSHQPARCAYNIGEILNTPYDYTNIQTHYFYIDNWDRLYEIQHSNELISALNAIDLSEKIIQPL